MPTDEERESKVKELFGISLSDAIKQQEELNELLKVDPIELALREHFQRKHPGELMSEKELILARIGSREIKKALGNIIADVLKKLPPE